MPSNLPSLSFLFLLLLLVGCPPAGDDDDSASDDDDAASDDDDDSAADDDDDDDSTEQDWAPVEGTYTLGTPIFNPNECGMTADNAADEAVIGDLDTLGLTMSIGFLSPDGEPVTCLYTDDGSFMCSVSTFEVDMTPMNLPATIRTVQNMSGSFSESGLLGLSISYESSCIEGNCALAEMFLGDLPCSTAYTVNASLNEG